LASDKPAIAVIIGLSLRSEPCLENYLKPHIMQGVIKILFVEDVLADAELLFRELAKSGVQFTKELVDNEKSYITALTSFFPDIIISDYSLPSFNGLDALRLKNQHYPETPFILVTGSINEETAVECMKAGADDYIIKQNLTRLVPAIKSTLEKKEIIIAKKKAEAALRESEDIFNSFMEHSPVYVFFKDKNTRPIRLSKNYEKMLGLPLENILGKTMDELFPSDLAKSMIQDDLDVINKGVPLSIIETFNDRVFETTKFPVKWLDGTNYLAGFTIDITRQKVAEEALLKSEAFSRMLIESSPIGILHLDKEGIITYENSASKRIMGVPEGTNSPVIGKNIFDIPNIKSISNQTVLEKFQSKAPIYGEIIHYRSLLGIEVDAEIFTTPISDSLGNYDGLIVMINNITERLRDQVLLKEKTQKLNTIVNNLQGVVYQCLNDRDWTIIYMNDGILELSGYPAEDFTNNKIRSFNSIIHPDDQVMVRELIQKSILEKKHYTIEYRIITSSGSEKWVWEKGHGVFENDQFVTLEGFISDITERKQGEILIKKLSEVVEQSPSSTIITDANGKIEFTNAQFTSLTQYTLEDVKGKNPRIFNPGHYSQAVYDTMMDSLHASKVWKSEFANRKKDGTNYWENVIISALTDNNGQISNFILITEDITETKQMLDDLIKAKLKAEESDRLKTAFLQNISHEIRTPMNAIVGFTGILNNQDANADNRKYYTEIIKQSSNQLLAVISDIVSIATLESGQELVREHKTSTNSILKLIYDQFIGKAKSLGILLNYKTTLSDEDATILTDETKLIQILTNLIGNAIKFTKEGFVDFGYSLKDDYLEFYSKDSGIGIPEEMHERIFDRFRQADATTAQEYGGTGLGLSISKEYVKLMGGKIRIESQPGKGTQIYFTIPYKKIKSSSSNPENQKQEVYKIESAKTILVAEDEDFNFKLISELLSVFEVKIIRAITGVEAVDFCRSNPKIDLVIMDIKMPLMNGYDATKIIKGFRPELNIIAQTAYAFDNDKAKALESGCCDYISKPFGKQQFLALIKKYLECV